MKTNTNYIKYADELKKALKSEIFDQEFAIETLIKTLIQSEIINNETNLKEIFTFLGYPNCGKQYLLEQLVKYDPNIDKLKIFHMDQYSGNYALGEEQLSVISLQNEVITFVQQYPNSILFFDDIEKADLQVQLGLYTLFTDYEKSELDLSNIVAIISTTKLASILNRSDLQNYLKNEPLKAHTFLMEKLHNETINVEGTIENLFHPKLLSLMNQHEIIPFNKLGLDTLFKIASRSIHNMSKDFIKESNITIEYKEIDTIVSLLTLSLSPYLNAKYIKQKLPKILFDKIYEALSLNNNITNINCYPSKKAKKFLKDNLKDQKALLTKINKQGKSITLKWKLSQKDACIDCVIKDAFFTTETLKTSSNDIFQISEIGFENVAGHEKVKKQLTEILSLLKEPERLKQFNLQPPKGMILHGPAGMGKKLLAKAFAKEVNMPYTVITGSALFDQTAIHQAYAKAYGKAPAIIIIEDIDTEGILNGMVSTMSFEPILQELDSLSTNFEAPIFTILTLNDTSPIPEYLLQANRIDLVVEVPKLDMEARRFFIENILKKPHDDSIDVEKLVKYISGMSGNELQRIGQESSLYAARKGLKELTGEILLEQINIIKYGTKLENKQIRDIELSMAKTAYHEAGHAVLSYILLPKINIEQVTIAPRSESLGFVSYHNEEYIDATSKKDIFNDICVLLAGRIAKMEKFGEDGGMETGAVSDLEAATMQTYAAIALFGMDEELGYINISTITASIDKQLFASKIEERILYWVDKAKKKTEQEVKRLWKAIDAVAKALIEKEMIDGNELKIIIDKNIKK
jgi:ATP-dependent Zn protease